jgi:hypothetical protein
MHRTQLLLEEWQFEELKVMAEREGRSISDLVREIVSERLGKRGMRSTTLDDLAGLVREGPADLGENHDHYLYGARKKRR